jgi:hypothetical protein
MTYPFISLAFVAVLCVCNDQVRWNKVPAKRLSQCIVGDKSLISWAILNGIPWIGSHLEAGMLGNPSKYLQNFKLYIHWDIMPTSRTYKTLGRFFESLYFAHFNLNLQIYLQIPVPVGCGLYLWWLYVQVMPKKGTGRPMTCLSIK